MSYPPNSFNQAIQQELLPDVIKEVVVLFKETYDSHSRELRLPTTHLDSLEYVDGTLITRFSGAVIRSRIIPWERVKDIYFNTTIGADISPL